MKINVRLLLITFIIVVLVSVTSTLTYYSLTNKILHTQQGNTLVNSANDFIFTFQNSLEQTEHDFQALLPSLSNIRTINLDGTNIDFLFTLVADSIIDKSRFKRRNSIYLNEHSKTIWQFLSNNPNIILKYYRVSNNLTVYYGKLISSDYLSDLSKRIRAEIALIINGTPVELSNPNEAENYLLSIMRAAEELRFEKNFELAGENLKNADFLATYYTPRNLLTLDHKISFLIFSASKEAAEFRATMGMVTLVVIVAGVALALILVMLFTAKFRKQISLLSSATQITVKGDLDHRVKIVTQDELGKLGKAFNGMLDELKRKEKAEKDYSEFITLINQNPSLTEVSEAALSKIIHSTGLSLGILYLVSDDNLKAISSYGVDLKDTTPSNDIDFYKNAIEKRNPIVLTFDDNHPVIKTGLAEIKIQYLLIVPIIYNNEVIAILELASNTVPSTNPNNYLDYIQEQLAIGLTNAKAFEQMKNLVENLRLLNEEYQSQNKKITQQNEEFVKLHEELKKKAEELERQRTKALELASVKSEFLANMSHELRTPLISILGLTELVYNDESTLTKTKERLKIVVRNGKKLLQLISNVLEFSKIESGKSEINAEIFSLPGFIEDIRSSIEPLAFEKKLTFDIKRDNCNYTINTDKNKLEQTLINLLGNAVKFTEQGSIKLNVSVLNEVELKLEVIDAGIGISEEEQKIIFDAFQQADGSTSRKHSGSGLGLAISKEYVEQLNGTISLRSQEGQGSIFTIVLPGVIEQKIDVLAEEDSIRSDIDTNECRTVLVINDDEQTKKLIGDYLKLNGFDVIFSPSAADALKKLNEVTPDAITLDIHLPDADGWQLLKEFKDNSVTEDIPIIMLSINEEERYGYALGVFEYLVEPINDKRMFSVIKKLENFSDSKVHNVFFLSENNEENIVLKERMLAAGFEINFVGEASQAFNSLTSEMPDLIVIDLITKDSDAIRTIDKLKENIATKYIPVIVNLPKDLSTVDIEKLNRIYGQVTLESKHHPMDVLKVLRDRLNIVYDVRSKNKFIVEEFKDKVKEDTDVSSEESSSKLKILIVDDDNDTLFTVGEIVNSLGYETLFAKNGVECLLTLQNMRPDLILLDIMMPHMDGFETVKRLRQDKRLKNIPVFALTAHAMLEDKEVIERNGFDDLVTKPVNTAILAFKVQKKLKQNEVNLV